MQRDRDCTGGQVTTLIYIAIVTFVMACTSKTGTPQLTNPQGFALAAPGASLRLTFTGDPTQLIARRELSLQFRIVEGLSTAPDSLELVVDMPSMSHGPTRAVLQRSGELYGGKILFVMGGEWVVDFRSDSKSLGRAHCYVHER